VLEGKACLAWFRREGESDSPVGQPGDLCPECLLGDIRHGEAVLANPEEVEGIIEREGSWETVG
jgi:hypothetical protein